MPRDAMSQYLTHLQHVTKIRGFRGRSQPSEFIVFIAVLMIACIVVEILSIWAGGTTWSPFNQYFQLCLWFFATPLFVRRLHDQDRSGLFALILPLFVCLKLYAQILYDEGRLPVPNFGPPLNALELGLVVLFWVLVLWPGTNGDNRFGPSPRKTII